MTLKKRKIIVVALVYFIIFTTLFGFLFYNYCTGQPRIGFLPFSRPTSIHNIDEEKNENRPYKYITQISSSNINSVEDFYIPKFFDNDNITVYFPEEDVYLYFVVNRPGDPAGGLTFYSSNGSIMDNLQWESVDEGATGGRGSCSRLPDFEGGNIIMDFSGSGIIIFFSESISDMFQDSSDYSGTVRSGLVAFCLPWELMADLPRDRRIESEVTSNDRKYFHVRYYDEALHLLGETKGSRSKQTQIPSGNSWMVFVVVESQGNVTFRFRYSDLILGSLNFWGYLLFGGFLLALVCVIVIIVLYRRILWEKGRG